MVEQKETTIYISSIYKTGNVSVLLCVTPFMVYLKNLPKKAMIRYQVLYYCCILQYVVLVEE